MTKDKVQRIQKNVWFEKSMAEDIERQAKEMDIPFSSFVKFKIFGGKNRKG